MLLEKNVRILFGCEISNSDNLFEEILKTDNKDHSEFIRNIWIEFKLMYSQDVLTTVSLFNFMINFL